MADVTSIEWADATCNAINGCSLKSPGCRFCYAMKQAHRTDVRRHLVTSTAGGMVWTGEVDLHERALLQPLSWRRPRRIFWNAHGDTFHEKVPDEWIDKVFAVCALTPQHVHMILTKRPERMRAYMVAFEDRPDAFGEALAHVARAAGLPFEAGIEAIDAMQWPLPNVWLGTSVEDQTRADERIPHLLATPAAVRFLSCEPLLGPVDLTALDTNQGWDYMDSLNSINISAEWRDWCAASDTEDEQEILDGFVEQYGRAPDGKPLHPTLDWVIVGGESGTDARPMYPYWVRDIRDQCAAADVPFFFKQWGTWGPDEGPDDSGADRIADGRVSCAVLVNGNWQYFRNGYEPPLELCSGHGEHLYKVGKKAAGRLLDGVEHNGVPA